jgi:hypothetical protein
MKDITLYEFLTLGKWFVRCVCCVIMYTTIELWQFESDQLEHTQGRHTCINIHQWTKVGMLCMNENVIKPEVTHGWGYPACGSEGEITYDLNRYNVIVKGETRELKDEHGWGCPACKSEGECGVPEQRTYLDESNTTFSGVVPFHKSRTELDTVQRHREAQSGNENDKRMSSRKGLNTLEVALILCLCRGLWVIAPRREYLRRMCTRGGRIVYIWGYHRVSRRVQLASAVEGIRPPLCQDIVGTSSLWTITTWPIVKLYFLPLPRICIYIKHYQH